LARLLLRRSSGGARAVLEVPQFMAPPKWLRLLCFLPKKDSFMKTFGRAPLKEPEQEPGRSLPNRPNKIINKETLSGFFYLV